MSAELPEITEVQRMALKPGDVLVLHLNADRLSAADADRVKARVRDLLGNPALPVLVLASGSRVEIVEGG